MTILDIIKSIGQLISKCLSERDFTGKIIITLHCRNGGIGKATSNIEREIPCQEKDNQL